MDRRPAAPAGGDERYIPFRPRPTLFMNACFCREPTTVVSDVLCGDDTVISNACRCESATQSSTTMRRIPFTRYAGLSPMWSQSLRPVSPINRVRANIRDVAGGDREKMHGTMEVPMPIRGRCLCGGVAFEMTGTPIRVNHCHCSRCRKARGTANATNLAVPLDGLCFVRGTELLTTFRAPGAKYFAHVFCKVCGSSMPRLDEARAIAIVPMGSFDDDPGVRPERHIFVDSKAPWDDITDDLPRFPGSPPAL